VKKFTPDIEIGTGKGESSPDMNHMDLNAQGNPAAVVAETKTYGFIL
jgi:hypothetical protein